MPGPAGANRAPRVLRIAAVVALALGALFAVSALTGHNATVVTPILSGYLIGLGVALLGLAQGLPTPGRGWGNAVLLAGGALICVVAGYALAHAGEVLAVAGAGEPPSRQGFRFGLSLLILGPAVGLITLIIGISAMVTARRQQAGRSPDETVPSNPA